MNVWGRGIQQKKTRNAIKIIVWSVDIIYKRRIIGFYRKITY
jgi:hypothetical protein